MKVTIAAAFFATVFLSGCTYTTQPPKTSFSYKAYYSFVLDKVERPEKAISRYGVQKIDRVSSLDEKYKYIFEDKLVKVLWVVTSKNIYFSLSNKTDHSIKIPWDEAAYVDENGQSHRVMHAGVKFDERSQSLPHSVVVRGGYVEDLVSPTDYVYWREGNQFKAGDWETKSLFLDLDYHFVSYFIENRSGIYDSRQKFDAVVKRNIGKKIQVLLPLQIEDVINDYLFTFRVESVFTTESD